jgi:hypothetical protein
VNYLVQDPRVDHVLEIQAQLLEKHLTQNAATRYRIFIAIAPDDCPELVSCATNLSPDVYGSLVARMRDRLPAMVEASQDAPA